MLERLEDVFNKYYDRIAYKNNDSSITYSELWNSACKYADYLKRQPIMVLYFLKIWLFL